MVSIDRTIKINIKALKKLETIPDKLNEMRAVFAFLRTRLFKAVEKLSG